MSQMNLIYHWIGFLMFWAFVIIMSYKFLAFIHQKLKEVSAFYCDLTGFLSIPYFWIEVQFTEKEVVQRRYDWLLSIYNSQDKKQIGWGATLWFYRKRLGI